MTLPELREAALDILQHALREVDARVATRKALNLRGANLQAFESEFAVAEKPIYVVAIGKAALSMSLGVTDVLGERISEAIISGLPIDAGFEVPANYTIFQGGHPIPNDQSLSAAQAVFRLLNRASAVDALIIFLISGGGSAMLESPIRDDISLADLQETNRLLITCGSTINEINSVRRAISAVKGGGLAAHVRRTDFVTLIVSDTNFGDESSVASGPTLAPPIDTPSAEEVVSKYRLNASLPQSVLKAVQIGRKAFDLPARPHYVLLDNRTAISAAAERAAELGFSVTVAEEISEQNISDGVCLLFRRTDEIQSTPSCLVSGGEFSCVVKGDGRGGRNLETVLRGAIKLEQRKATRHTVVLSAGSDGIDGSSFAAGAIADETTISRGRQIGLDPTDYLERSDSHSFFESLNDLIVTGPTGTNVRDLRIVLQDKNKDRTP